MPRKRPDGRAPDWNRLHELAARQAGNHQLGQAREEAYSPPLLEYYLRDGRVERTALGIFRLTHYLPGDHEDLVVAWPWSDRLCVFSQETALLLHELSDALPTKQRMTAPSARQRRRLRVPANLVLQFADLGDRNRARKGSLPITTPLRTLADCAAANSPPPDLVTEATRQGVTGRSMTAAGSAPRRGSRATSTVFSIGVDARFGDVLTKQPEITSEI